MGRHEFDRGGPFWAAVAVLFGVTGALLAPGCGDADVSAGEVTAAANPAIEREVSDLQQQVAEADRGAQREIEQARANSEKMPVAARDRLTDAIERTEEARAEAGDRLEELKNSGGTHWQARRSRVVEALDELEQARHDVVAAFSGGEPSLSDG
jgi:acyl-CoA reductase-like NAD-dependent aldehyde dehydrogenase